MGNLLLEGSKIERTKRFDNEYFTYFQFFSENDGSQHIFRYKYDHPSLGSVSFSKVNLFTLKC